MLRSRVSILTPTINIDFEPLDFCFLCQWLDVYLGRDLKEDFSNDKNVLSGFSIHSRPARLFFWHDSSFQSAKDQWNGRKCRVNFGKIRVMVSRLRADGRVLYEFQLIPYKKWFFMELGLELFAEMLALLI